MNVVILDYNAGNTRSVLFALERIGVNAVISSDSELIRNADKVILPGVGEAGSAMAYLRKNGLDKTLLSLRQPVLGICLGMQLLCRHSEEGNTDCLGIFNVDVKRFNTADAPMTGYKVPQTGWNNIYNLKPPLFKGIEENTFMYFVHSYYAGCMADTISTTDHITRYSSALQKDNFYAVQFHPEKSAAAGQKVLENFIAL